jgi:hypothetical protein
MDAKTQTFRPTTSHAAPHWDEVMELLRAEEPNGPSAYQGLASALSEMATRDLLPQVREALRDRSLGSARIFFLGTLTRLRAPDRWELISEAAEDPELAVEANHMLHQRDLRRARESRTRTL